MKRDDLFITDSRLEVIQDFYRGDEYEISNWEERVFIGIKRKVDLLNGL